MIEAAIITPLLMTLTFVLVDFSVIFFVYLALESGVSQATRYGVTGNVMGGLSREESIKAAMRDATPTLNIDDAAFTFTHMTGGGGGWVGGTGGPDDIEKVSINYSHEVLVLRPLFPGGRLNIRVESAMKNEGRFE